MSRIHHPYVCLLALSLISLAGCFEETGPSGGRTFWQDGIQYEEYETEHTDYHPPEVEFRLTDDVLDPTLVPDFDPALVYPDLVGGWEVNFSHAVIELDVPEIKPDVELSLLSLHPTYAAAIEAAGNRHEVLIPSVNLINGKAKQFDDGLYAALDLAYYEGMQDDLRSHVDFIQALFEAVPPDGQAAPFLAAGLSLAGIEVTCSRPRCARSASVRVRRQLAPLKAHRFLQLDTRIARVLPILEVLPAADASGRQRPSHCRRNW